MYISEAWLKDYNRHATRVEYEGVAIKWPVNKLEDIRTPTMTIVQTYEIETSENTNAILQAFADSVKFMMDPEFTGLDIRNPETGVGEVEVNFDVKVIHTKLANPNEVIIHRSRLNALQLHMLEMLLK
jgi:hypothetical protein